MTIDFDNLIRGARPATSDLARQRVIAQVVPAFVPVVPVPWVRIAAALLAAFGAGFAAVAWLAGDQTRGASPTAQLAQDLRVLDARLGRLQAPSDLSAEVAALVQRADTLSRRLEQPESFNAVVARMVDQRNAERREREMEAHRERHLAYARSHYQQEVDRAVISMKRDYRLTDEQEQQVRKVFQEHGRSAEALISNCYRGKPRHGDQVSDEFEKLALKTQGRLEALLSEVPRVMPGADLAEWGPNPDPSSLSDYETWVRWNEETSRQG